MSSVLIGLVSIVLSHLPTQVDAIGPPLVVGHRGLIRHAPENTLAGFRACLGLRIGFEVDVQRARDGTLVCLHDATVDRTTDGRGPLNAQSVEQIKTLDAGSRFDRSFSGERVPTVEEVLDLLAADRGSGILVAIDLKADDAYMARDVVGLARRLGVLDRLVFIGLAIVDPDLRRRLRQADPHAHVARLAESPPEFEAAMADPDCDWIYLRAIPPGSDVVRAREAGKRIFIAGAEVAGIEAANWRAAADSGVDAILTDFPLEFRATFRPEPR
jgi:glycerophosphoryl diester phosphodiesterase